MQKKLTRSGPIHQSGGSHQRHQRGGLAALGGGDHHDVVHLGVDGMHPLQVVFGNVDDPDRKDQTRVLPVVDMPGLTAPVRHQSVGLLTDFQWGKPDLMRQPRGMGNQRVADDVEYLLLLEAVAVEQELVGFLGFVGNGQGRGVLDAQRLVLPGEGAGLGEAHVDSPVDIRDLLGQHERRRQVETPERLQVTRADLE